MRTIQFFKLLYIFEIFPNKMLEKKNFFLRFVYLTQKEHEQGEGEKKEAGSVLSRGAGSPMWGWIPGPGDHIT